MIVLRKVVTILLLTFVGVSLGRLILHETRTGSQDTLTETTGKSGGQNLPHKVVVYYFHGNFRCPTCRAMEAYAQEAIQGNFENELKSGKLEWRVVNIEKSGNEHFVKEYGLTTRSIIVSEILEGQQSRWKDLIEIWDHVKDKPAYTAYIVAEIRAYLNGAKLRPNMPYGIDYKHCAIGSAVCS